MSSPELGIGHAATRVHHAFRRAAVTTWPIAASAQQSERVRRVGESSAGPRTIPMVRPGSGRSYKRCGNWAGRSPTISTPTSPHQGAADRGRAYAAELVALAPDVIVTSGASTVGPRLQVTRTVPVVFAAAVDPVGAGFVDSLARPGGNATGFTSYEYSMGGKWLELLKEIAPGVTRVAVLRDAATSAGTGQFGAIQAVAPSLGVERSPINMRDAAEIEHAITEFAHARNGGLIVTTSGRRCWLITS